VIAVAFAQNFVNSAVSLKEKSETSAFRFLCWCVLVKDPRVNAPFHFCVYPKDRQHVLCYSGSQQQLKVREHKVLGPYVDGLQQLLAPSAEDVQELMSEGSKSRTVAATKMNAESSRSHAVFTLIVTHTMTDLQSGVRCHNRMRFSFFSFPSSSALMLQSWYAEQTGLLPWVEPLMALCLWWPAAKWCCNCLNSMLQRLCRIVFMLGAKLIKGGDVMSLLESARRSLRVWLNYAWKGSKQEWMKLEIQWIATSTWCRTLFVVLLAFNKTILITFLAGRVWFHYFVFGFERSSLGFCVYVDSSFAIRPGVISDLFCCELLASSSVTVVVLLLLWY